MKIGDITEFGEISLVSWDKCFVQFCDPGGRGVLGVHSMTFKEIENVTYDKEKRWLKVD